MKNLKPFKCFFSYYGSKAKIANKYPKPKHHTVIEPFCGAANYAVANFDNNVVLRDTNPVIVDLWKYLIAASPKDILGLPSFYHGLDLDSLNLAKEERYFLGFWANRGSVAPRRFVSNFAVGNSNGNVYFENVKKQVADNLFRIRHWDVKLDTFENIPTWFPATWFIDPPYVNGGNLYIKTNVDYKILGKFCNQLTGQVIVCESFGADWLPFVPLCENVGSRRVGKEVVFIKNAP